MTVLIKSSTCKSRKECCGVCSRPLHDQEIILSVAWGSVMRGKVCLHSSRKISRGMIRGIAFAIGMFLEGSVVPFATFLACANFLCRRMRWVGRGGFLWGVTVILAVEGRCLRIDLGLKFCCASCSVFFL